MARPLKEKSNLKRTYSFKTTEEMGVIWDAKIAAADISASEFFRQAVEQNQTVISPPKNPRAPKIKRSIDEQKILFLLSQLGNNINQIAHQLNLARRAGIVSPHLYQDIFRNLEIIADGVKDWRP